MSGIDDSQNPPEVPEEYAAVYRDAYRRALEEDPGPVEELFAAGPPDQLVPLAPAGEGLRRNRVPLLVGLMVLVLVAAGFGIVSLLSGDDDPAPGAGPAQTTRSPRASRPPKASATPSTEPTAAATSVPDAWDGAVVPVVPDLVEATCTSAPGVDSGGQAVTYDAVNTLDGDPSTAWRCDGRALGEVLTISLPAGTEVAELGLIPGYAKTDPDSGIDRYAENNRITRVRWTFGDGVVVEQTLDPSPGNREMQSIRVPRTASGTVTLEVLAVKNGGRRTTAISEIEVAAAAG